MLQLIRGSPPDQNSRNVLKEYIKNRTVTCRYEVMRLGGSDLPECARRSSVDPSPMQLLMDPCMDPI
jgi:hypothetical protein